MADQNENRPYENCDLGDLGEKISGAAHWYGRSIGVNEAARVLEDALGEEAGKLFMLGRDDEARTLRDTVIPKINTILLAHQKELRDYYDDELRYPRAQVFEELQIRDGRDV